MSLRGSPEKGSGFNPALALVVLLCAPSLGYLGALCWEQLLGLLNQPIPSNPNYAVVAVFHVITFPWAYLAALGMGMWVSARATRTARIWAWVILTASLIPNVLLWDQYARAF
jgi:hypothetical protein